MGIAVPYSEIKGLRLDEAVARIAEQKRPVSDMKLYDLLFSDTEFTRTNRHGIYVFFKADGKPAYVGKNSSNHFAQRIAAHFGLSKYFWGNCFLTYFIEKAMGGKIDGEHLDTFAAAAREASKYSLAIVPTNEGRVEGLKEVEIGRFEKLFRVYLTPEFNTYHRKREFRKCLGTLSKVKDTASLEDLVTGRTPW